MGLSICHWNGIGFEHEICHWDGMETDQENLQHLSKKNQFDHIKNVLNTFLSTLEDKTGFVSQTRPTFIRLSLRLRSWAWSTIRVCSQTNSITPGVHTAASTQGEVQDYTGVATVKLLTVCKLSWYTGTHFLYYIYIHTFNQTNRRNFCNKQIVTK